MTKFFRTTEKRYKGWVAIITRWKLITLRWGSINNYIVRASAGKGPSAKVRENTRREIQWERTRATLKSQWGENFQSVCRRQLKAISTKRLSFCHRHKALWRLSTQQIWVPILPKYRKMSSKMKCWEKWLLLNNSSLVLQRIFSWIIHCWTLKVWLGGWKSCWRIVRRNDNSIFGLLFIGGI